MGFFDLLQSSFGKKDTSAQKAKERLQILISSEHAMGGFQNPILEQMKKEIMAVIEKYYNTRDRNVQIDVNKKGDLDVIDVSIGPGND